MKRTNPKTVIFVVIGICFIFGTHNSLFAQLNGDVPGFDKNTFSYYFDRADREVSPDRWMEEARRGISIARSSWERLAADLITEEGTLAAAGRAVEAWTEEELEERFTQWLQKRFFGSGVNVLTNKAAGELGNSTLEYVYHMDKEGNIVLDDITGDPLLIRPDEGRDFTEERASWRIGAEGIGQQAVNEYRTAVESMVPELLTYIRADRKDSYEALLREAMGESVARYATEIDNLVAREERLLVAKRTSDVLSLRKKSEEKAASAIVSRLLAETEGICNEGIASIQARIESAEGGTGDLALAGEEWLEAYREQFERGLQAWGEAEERFFLRRMEWEQEAGKTYLMGEGAWSNAYNEIVKERQNWESKAKALFESGETVFMQASKNLQEAIAVAKEEFQRDAAQRTQAGSDRAKAWVDTYITTGSVVAGSRENVGFWYGKYQNQTAPELDSEAFVTWMKGGMQGDSQGTPASGDEEFTVWIDQEIGGFWKDMAETFQESEEYKALAARAEATRPAAERTRGWVEEEYQRIENLLADIKERLEGESSSDEKTLLQVQLLSLETMLGEIQPWMDDYEGKHEAAESEYETALNAFRPERLLLEEIKAVIAGDRSIEQQQQIISALRSRGLYFDEQYDIAQEIAKWSKLYYAYRERVLEARDALVNDFGLVMGTGALVDILQDGVSSEDFNLDEYQIELIRAQAVAGYWQKRVNIAQAVNKYAEDLTAGRMTDAEGVKAWEEAKAAYEQALEDYAEAQGRLTAAGDDVKEAQVALGEAAEALKAIDGELDKLNREYAAKMASYQINQNIFLLNEMAAMYNDLLKTNNLLVTDSNSVYITYLEKARALGVAEAVESGAAYLSGLIYGTESGISLAELRRRYDDIPEISSIDDLPGNIEGFNLEKTNPYYGVISGLLAGQVAELQGITAEAEIAKIKAKYKELIIEAAKAAKASAGQDMQDRVIAMGLLAADTVTDWYYSYSGRPKDKADETLLKEQGVYQRLSDDLSETQWNYVAKRAALEKAALEYHLGNSADVNEQAEWLAAFCSLDDTAAADAVAELEKVLVLLESRSDLSPTELQRQLEALNSSDGIVSFLAQGGSFFTVNGKSLTDIIMAADIQYMQNLASMMQAYEEIGFGSAAVEQENITAAFMNLQGLFASYGLTVETGEMPRLQALVDAIRREEGNLEQGVARFLVAVDQASGGVPDWLGQELDDWQSSVLAYAATRAGYLAEGRTADSDTLKESVKEKEAGLQQILKVFDYLETGEAGVDAQAICALLELPGDIGGLDRDLLEDEAVIRIGKAIAKANKAIDMTDKEQVRTVLIAEVNKNHGYASQGIRDRAVDRAFELLSITYGLQTGADPATFTGYGREIMLQDLFFASGLVDVSVNDTLLTEIASYCAPEGLLASRSAYFLIQELSKSFTEDTSREAVLAAWYGTIREDDSYTMSSWLENVYAMYGTAFGDKVREMVTTVLSLPEFSVAVCGEMFSQWFSTGLGTVAGFLEYFADDPLQNIVKQLAVYDLAASLESTDTLEAVLDELGLGISGSVQALHDQVREADFNAVLEALAVQDGTVGAEGILYRLKWYLLNGEYQAYETERAWYEAYAAAQYSAGSAEANAAEASLAQAGELHDFMELAKRYAGSLVSADALTWALEQYKGDCQKALRMAGYLTKGSIREPMMDMLNWDHIFPGGNAVVEQLISGAVMELIKGTSTDINITSLQQSYSTIYEKAVQARETSKDDEHWRIYVSGGNLLQEYNNKLDKENRLVFSNTNLSRDEADEVKGARSWLEGALIDLTEEQERNGRKLEDMYARYMTETLWERQEAFQEAVREYISDTSKDWEAQDIYMVEYELKDEYARAANNYLMAYEMKKQYAREVGIYGDAYKLAKNEAALAADLGNLSLRIHSTNTAYEQAADYYATAADAFADAGNTYDRIYGEVKKEYEFLENKRFEYEVQDAIRRWASTAYLSQGDSSAGTAESLLTNYKEPLEELAYSQERLDRAVVALDALKGLYDNGETDRLYENNEYDVKYKDYQKSFSRMILSAKANASTASALAKEYEMNQKYCQSYYSSLNTYFGNNETYSKNYTNYKRPETPEEYQQLTWKDAIYLDADGKLKLSYGSGFKISLTTEEQAADLLAYFTADTTVGSDFNDSSAFERAVRQWSQRMAQYNFTQDNRLQNWGLARDYLMRMMNNANDFAFISGYNTANALDKQSGEKALYGFLFGYDTVGDILDVFRKQTMAVISGWDKTEPVITMIPGLYGQQEAAWQGMNASEKADLEFYIILSLLNGNDIMGFDAITNISAYQEYIYFEKDFLPEYRYYEKRNKWYRPICKKRFSHLERVRNGYRSEWENLKKTVASGGTELNNGIASFNNTYQTYVASCEKINTLKGVKTGDEFIVWDDIEKALIAAKVFTTPEIEELSIYWTDYTTASPDKKYQDIQEALAALANWSESARKDARDMVEAQWKDDEQERKSKEQTYRAVYEAYIAGTATKEQLEEAAAEVYGDDAAARKTHQKKMAEVLMSDLGGIIEDGGEHMSEYITLANEYALLIRQAYGSRFEAELSAREAEWSQQVRDIDEKYKSWVEASGLILERGRQDWLDGIESFNGKRAEWRKRFETEYTQISDAWAAAYLGGLEDKAAWVEQATAAADNALTGTMLAMVGAEAEAGARKFDTLDPVSMPGLGGVEEASGALSELLNMAGITGMENAFTAMAGAAGTVSSQVQRGLGGINGMNTWNAGQLQAAATAFARESNALLAAGEAKKLAYMAREMAQEAIEGLHTSVQEANDGFAKSMDETFTTWEKNGNTYTRKIIVYSTIWGDEYERESVEGYRNYIMTPFELKTDLSEQRLVNLSSLAIQVLIGDAQEEVKEKSEGIFGTAEENSKQAKIDRTKAIDVYKKVKEIVSYKDVVHTNDDGLEYTARIPVYEWKDAFERTEYRAEGAGEFGQHIGYAPVTVAEPDVDKGKNSLYVDPGKGELGRIMSEYIYYQMKESQGWMYANQAPWEKPLWDDRETISAPSLRSVVDIGMQVVTTIAAAAASPFTGGASLAGAIALNTAINMADDAVFGILDVAGGYKSIGEAGFEFGKKALSSAATSTVSAGFGGFSAFGSSTQGLMGMASNGLTGMSKVIAQTAVTGMQSMTTTLMNSTINSFTYSDKNGFGFSSEAFSNSMQSGLVSMAAGVTSSFTRGMMEQVNLFDGNNLELSNNIFNKNSINNFNSLVGGLAGQGIEYALGGEFTMNILNLNMFSGLGLNDRNGNAVNMGLMEMRLGRDGFDMGLGTGGVDASLGTIASSMSGLKDTLKISSAKISSLFGNQEQLSTLNGINMLGYTSNGFNHQLGRGIWNGTIKTKYANLGTNEYGRFDSSNPAEILLNNALLGMGKEEAAKLASVMAHEGTHAAGNRYESVAHQQGLGTYLELLSSFELTDDTAIVESMVKALQDPASYMENSGLIDFFRKSIDGIFYADGATNNRYITEEYYNEEGELKTRIRPETKTETSQSLAIAKYLGMRRTQELLGRGETVITHEEYIQTIMDVFGMTKEAAESLLADSNTLSHEFIKSASEEQQLKYYGELMLKANGYSYSDNTGWTGGVGLPMSDLDIIDGGYNIYKNADGSYTSSYVRQIIDRDSDSFFGTQGGYGIDPDKSENHKGLDSAFFVQYDMYHTVLNYLLIDSVQTVDVYNVEGRNQPIDTYKYGVIQGNTIMSDFTFQYNAGGTTLGTIINAWTLSEHWVGADGKNLDVDRYRWLQEGSKNMSSDGCFIYKIATKDLINNTFQRWGINRYTYIQGVLNTPHVMIKPAEE